MHQDKLIMVSKRHSDYTTKKSSYEAVLMYKGNKSEVITEYLENVTANRCALLGYISLIKRLRAQRM